ncbi:uncharacterized protein LOC129603143 isoform X2 [Betta splendens]|uniref:Uncharacterized protein LOC129603143 isoform X2 n=1 Tax=Betta splendens TaxID=158456 RepID=A0A9W2XBR9_BETSP|nr:uncharacterized protein LOC129603143 isoform X2 [Betta splendens]
MRRWLPLEGRWVGESRMAQTEAQVNVLPRISAQRRDAVSLDELDCFRRRFALREEKRYNPSDPTLKFVETEDELDFLYEGFRSRRALMSCGHAVTPTSLTKWCMKLLDEGRSGFVCGQTGCNVEWSYEEVCKMALLTPEEKKLFEKAMRTNSGSDQSGHSGLNHHNDGFRIHSLHMLQTCPEMMLSSVKCPSIRACPTCGILQQHCNGCRNVTCPRCNKYFCFVCLSVTSAHQCSAAALRQTSIPVWQKK